ncbi:MAG: lauroyl acyltransferase [Pararhodobacter sp.]|nr:lauroyl acyltransferase [Pararhodobacter sp.]
MRQTNPPPASPKALPAAPLALRHRLQDAALGAMIGLALRLPLARRVPLMGWLAQYLIAPVAGTGRRIRANLAHVMPELTSAQVRRLTGQVHNNIGRALIELFSGEDFVTQAAAAPMEGAGVQALAEAHAQGRPVILVTAHLGNYDVARAALLARGYRVGGLYMPMSNPAFNARYVAAIGAIGKPLFPRGRTGLGGMLRFLRQGGMLGMVADHYMDHGVVLDFMGKPARTALSAAELALRHDALLVPIYGIRQPDGLTFRVIAEAPVPHGDPVAMTQALNDSAAARIRANPEQWYWVHRRWKKADADQGQASQG